MRGMEGDKVWLLLKRTGRLVQTLPQLFYILFSVLLALKQKSYQRNFCISCVTHISRHVLYNRLTYKENKD